MTTAKGPEAGSLPVSVRSFEEAVVGRRGSSPKNSRGEGPALITPFEAFEVKALERISPAEFLDGLLVITECRKLYWCAEPEENMAKLKAIESIEDLLAQAKLGIITGIFGLTLDTKREIQNVFMKIGFTTEEINIFNIKRVAAEDIGDYLPRWAIYRVNQRLINDQEYALKVLSLVTELQSILEKEYGLGSPEALEDAVGFAIEKEARGLLETILGSLQGQQEQQDLGLQIEEELQFNDRQSRDRLRFLYRRRQWLAREERLKPLNEKELVFGLNKVASKLGKAA